MYLSKVNDIPAMPVIATWENMSPSGVTEAFHVHTCIQIQI